MAAKYGFGLAVTAFEQRVITAVTGGLGFSDSSYQKTPLMFVFSLSVVLWLARCYI